MDELIHQKAFEGLHSSEYLHNRTAVGLDKRRFKFYSPSNLDTNFCGIHDLKPTRIYMSGGSFFVLKYYGQNKRIGAKVTIGQCLVKWKAHDKSTMILTMMSLILLLPTYECRLLLSIAFKFKLSGSVAKEGGQRLCHPSKLITMRTSSSLKL